jgi:hypothetical protein
MGTQLDYYVLESFSPYNHDTLGTASHRTPSSNPLKINLRKIQPFRNPQGSISCSNKEICGVGSTIIRMIALQAVLWLATMLRLAVRRVRITDCRPKQKSSNLGSVNSSKGRQFRRYPKSNEVPKVPRSGSQDIVIFEVVDMRKIYLGLT